MISITSSMASNCCILLLFVSCRTVLTHFSQRYPRLPAGYPATSRPWRQRPLLAVDGAVVRFDLLPRLPGLMPAVAAALEELEEAKGEGPAAEL
jgi:hypothetical protein